jgi:hypothetical protein
VQKADHHYRQREKDLALRIGRDCGFRFSSAPRRGSGFERSVSIHRAVRLRLLDLN